MIQVRTGVFETNSSSTHSLTMYMKSELDALEMQERVVLVTGRRTKIITFDQMRKELKHREIDLEDVSNEGLKAWMYKLDEDGYYEGEQCGFFHSYKRFNDWEGEVCIKEITTPNGDVVVGISTYISD